MNDLIQIAEELAQRGNNVIIKNGVIILMTDSEFASYMSELMAS